MYRFRLCTALVLAAAVPAVAQQQQPGPPQPRLDAVMPLGAKAGATVAELTIAGSDLEETEAMLFSHAGIKAEVIIPPAPKPDPKDPKKKDPPPPAKGPPPPHKFKVTIAGDVPPGNYDVRVVNKHGVRFYDEGVRLYEQMSDELDFNVMFSQRGHLTLAHSDSAVRTMRLRAEVNQIEGVDSVALQQHLWQKHHILVTPIKHEEFEGIRVTPHVYTTLQEIDRFAEALETVLREGLPKS